MWSPCRTSQLFPNSESASTGRGWRPQPCTRSKQANAKAGFVWCWIVGGIPTSARRPGALAQLSGRKRAQVSGTDVVAVPRWTLTAT